MGVASGLFFSTNGDVDTLYSHIVQATSKPHTFKRSGMSLQHLIELAERSGYRMRSWLQGSYKMAHIPAR
jgi:hypothetical protein